MQLGQWYSAILTASLLFACGGPHPPHAPKPPNPAAESDGYVTIRPEVTVSAVPKMHPVEPAKVDENEDVMASILAIPPGR
jgi:hypothetical protein